MSAAARRGSLARRVNELTMGVRLSVAGGRSGWVRLVLIALGMGLGVAMLLLAATVPTMMAARGERLAAREVDRSSESPVPRGEDTLLIAAADSRYRDHWIHGRLVQPEGQLAPLPPGVTRQLAPGEMVASPALARLLTSDEGALLRGRWDARVVGTIGAAGLEGPGEYAFYLGTDRLATQFDSDDGSIDRVRSFGRQGVDEGGLGPALLLLAVVGVVVLLVPVAVFVTTAVRFGGEARDRRLAALRLVGADATMTARIAAGETLAGALLGLTTGGLLYLAVGPVVRQATATGFFPADFRPVPLLLALVAVLVPAAAVLVTMSALRQVVVGPLGVVRRSADRRRRRLWWRLLLPVAGLVLLEPLYDGLSASERGFEGRITAGLAVLLIGVAALLPWLVEATVGRLGGGGVAWELAVRRLQLDSGTAVRAVSGIAVSVAGAVALQGLLAAVETQYTAQNVADTHRFHLEVAPRSGEPAERWMAALSKVPGVHAVDTLVSVPARSTQPAAQPAEFRLEIGSCAVLARVAQLGACADGDTFVVDTGHAAPPPGTTYTLGRETGPEPGPETDPAPQWTMPAAARTVPTTGGLLAVTEPTILATPAALRGNQPNDPSLVDFYVALDPANPDAVEHVRNAAARVNPTAYIFLLEEQTVAATLLAIRQALLIGATALLLLIGASMVVNVAEQLQERRRVLAVLVAFGTRRTTLTGSVLYQIALPVLLGLTLAVATGTGLAALLQTAVKAPISFDWFGIGLTSGAAALVVLLTTAASLPLLWRLTRPDGLRSE